MPPLAAIVGSTGVGKSDFAIRIALELQKRKISAAIIGADAMQLYRGMDIGTAKIPISERQNIAHYMLDVLDPHEEASVSAYQRKTIRLIDELQSSQIVPILVGGSGLYVNSVLYRMNFAPHDHAVRAQLEEAYSSQGLDPLLRELGELDPQGFKLLDTSNPRRVIRALEVLRISGTPIAAQLPKKPNLLRKTLAIGINQERADLVVNLDARVVKMWQRGIVSETEQLLDRGIKTSRTARRAIGYAQAIGQLEGSLTESQAIEQTQLLTRRYARRQVSWFKRLPHLNWLSAEQARQAGSVQAVSDAIATGAQAMDGKEFAIKTFDV